MKLNSVFAGWGSLTSCLIILYGAATQAANVRTSLVQGLATPQNITINIGDTVTWLPEDAAFGFTYQVQDYAGKFQSPVLIGTNSFSHTFAQAGFVVYLVSLFAQGQIYAGDAGTITILAFTNGPPALLLNEPVDGFHLGDGMPIRFLASVTTPPSDVSRVDFLVETNFLGEATNSAYILAITNDSLFSSGVSPGAHTVVAIATYKSGIMATSPPVHIVVEQAPLGVLWGPRILARGDYLFFYVYQVTARREFIEFSGDLANWSPIGAVDLRQFTYGAFLDTTATNSPRRFYHLQRFH